MYSVQLSEFWKQRVCKETFHNCPFPLGVGFDDDDGASSVASSTQSSHRAASEASAAGMAAALRIAELEAKLEA
eukprot:CAMPEP_0206160906 /NCGR_PEP_ID=MMETSP1474-20131121/7217_1 /ASSEMBLY_ACC=CAM_ASM_001110 /TAXON_ID=97495 /ORGANISM="Imantonia sp., Strain RCC918" /LENGTH=73 /DNA_ID=CAMNT_0053562531 /DNA_START=51 /DNA_END=268 /DNA_ORIENTATION=+